MGLFVQLQRPAAGFFIHRFFQCQVPPSCCLRNSWASAKGRSPVEAPISITHRAPAALASWPQRRKSHPWPGRTGTRRRRRPPPRGVHRFYALAGGQGKALPAGGTEVGPLAPQLDDDVLHPPLQEEIGDVRRLLPAAELLGLLQAGHEQVQPGQGRGHLGQPHPLEIPAVSITVYFPWPWACRSKAAQGSPSKASMSMAPATNTMPQSSGRGSGRSCRVRAEVEPG